MMLLQKIKSNPYFIRISFVLLTFVVGFIIASPFFLSRSNSVSGSVTMLATHDMVQHLAVMQDFDKVLKSGVFYPRWLPDINNGYGIPWMNYYPPGFYYLSSFVHTFLSEWKATLFFISVLAFAASGITFYLLSRLFYSRFASAVAGLLYIAAPYHVLELYWRGAMPEFMGFILTPLIIYFTVKLGRRGKATDYAGLGIFYGLFLITHIPVAFLMSYVLALYGLIWAFRGKDWKIAFRIALGMVIGFLLSAIYLLPAALETKDIQEHFTNIFPYHASYITLLSVDDFGVLINYSFELQGLLILTSIAILSAAPLLKPSPDRDDNHEKVANRQSQTRLWIIMAIASAFMCTSLSIHISKLLPKIQVATFAWRWMVIAGLFTALLVAAAIDRLRDGTEFSSIRLWTYRTAIGAVIIFNIWFTIHQVIIGALSHPSHGQPAVYVDAGFTPAGSTHPQDLSVTDRVIIKPASGTSEVIRWEPTQREVVVNISEPSTVRLKTYNFPGWTARIDGEVATLSKDRDGVQVIEVPPGIHKLEVSFINTLPRTLGTILSGLGFLIIIGLTFVAQWQRKKSEVKSDGEFSEHKNEPESGAAVDVGVEGQGKGKWKWTDKRTRQIGIVSLLLLAVIFTLLMISRPFKKEENSILSNNAPTQSGAMSIGSEARLQIQGLDSILVSSDDNALHELMDALPKRDESAIEKLVQSGKVFRVPNGTKVRILEFGSSKTKVRIIEGNHLLLDGWVPERWVK